MSQVFTEEQVQEWDLRRQQQIKNQIASIDRLLEGDATYDAEMARLHDELANAQIEVSNLKRQLAELLDG